MRRLLLALAVGLALAAPAAAVVYPVRPYDAPLLARAATPYEQIANWPFVDYMLNFAEETLLSTIKIRQAGFPDCIDTHQSFRRQLTRLREMRIIP